MKKSAILILAILMMTTTVYAKTGFSKKASGKPVLIQEGPSKMWCPVCGMNLKMFYKTSHGVELNDGNKKQYCSIRCLVVDDVEIHEQVKQRFVIDAMTEKLISTAGAHYVIGSNIPGTMTKKSKYAFGSAKDAEAFHKTHGGKLATFEEAFDSAEKSLNSDIAMTDKKRKAKMYPMGKKLVQKKCPDINVKQYQRINQIKADLKAKKLCGELKEKQMQAVALYLWDVERTGHKEHQENVIKVGKDEKCPVCGMFVYKYPKWAAQIHITGKEKHLSFDGVKDLMKLYLEPQKWGDYKKMSFYTVLVTDYYTQKAIDGKKAYYVIGSNVLGPMGKELIPFETAENASIFFKDHLGKEIVTFDQIDMKLVNKLDE